ncbi:MAG: hypothetical protein Q7R59_00915 [bacterium]|nr:hypothetical protein [bacterium]
MAKAKKTSKGKVAAEIGAGLLAAGAAAAAGYYFYGSKSAAKHRKVAAKWAGDMKKEVIREAKRLERMNSNDFAKIVDAAARTYSGVRSINAADLKRAVNELKSNWKLVQREVQKGGKKTVKKIVKKARAKARKTR